jgi:hypothetical protein
MEHCHNNIKAVSIYHQKEDVVGADARYTNFKKYLLCIISLIKRTIKRK